MGPELYRRVYYADYCGGTEFYGCFDRLSAK